MPVGPEVALRIVNQSRGDATPPLRAGPDPLGWGEFLESHGGPVDTVCTERLEGVTESGSRRSRGALPYSVHPGGIAFSRSSPHPQQAEAW